MDSTNVFSVFEVSRHIRQIIETSIEPLYVAGEVSNFTHHSSGHMYFNLKDENATLRCTFFKNSNYRLDFKPQEGMQVVCYGKITVFEKGGTYNLNVQSMTKAGLGAMQAKLEELKRRLNQEGLFDAKHKQALPRYPDKIGIITSATGAALQDIKNVIMRRYPVEVQVYPASVQGAEAPRQLIAGLKFFNDMNEVELIILTRGGGSQEDLFCFNDEGLVRQIFASRLPVISAVGHEIDFCLSDFVADLRAPTPSAAAELAVPDKKELSALVSSLSRRLNLAAEKELGIYRQQLATAKLNVSQYHPEKLWQSYQQRFDMACLGLGNIHNMVRQKRQQFAMVSQRTLGILNSLSELKHSRAESDLARLGSELNGYTMDKLNNHNKKLEHTRELLWRLSPQNLQQKGWIMAYLNGKLISSAKQIKARDTVELSFADGNAEASIITVKEKT